VASGGYDVPSFSDMKTLKVGADAGPPRARSIATPTLTTTGCCRWRCQRLRSRSTRRASWPRWPLPSAGRANGGDP